MDAPAPRRWEISRPADIPIEEPHWRDPVLDRLAWTAVIAAAICIAMLRIGGDIRLASFDVPLGVMVLSAALVRKRITFRLRTWLLLGAGYLFGLFSLVVQGMPPHTLVIFEVTITFATLLVGKRCGLAMAAVTTGTVAATAVLHRLGAFGMTGVYDPLLSTPMSIARHVIIFGTLATGSVVAISYVLERAEDVLREKAHALDQLQREEREAARMTEVLARQDAALRKARELEILGRLAGMMAHDFNNALLVVQSNVDLIREDPGYLETGLGQVDEAVLLATSTTRQLRGFSPHASAGAKPVALDEIVERTAKLLRRVLPSNVQVTATSDGRHVVLADEGQLQGLLTNLALNARDAMPEGGKLDLSVREATALERAPADLQGRCALLAVTDDGVGMSDETLAHIFEAYFTTKGAAGTGLGLASVKKLVEDAGGRILVASTPGRGTQFRILWPLLDRPPSAAEPRGATDGARHMGTVLLVDDDKQVRAAMARMLASRGFTVLEAPSGDEALTAARRYQGTIDVICSDCVMPGMPVKQLIEAFRRVFPAARVLLCSSYAPEDVAPPRGMIDAFVAKPFTADTLAGLVGTLAERAADSRPPH